MLIKLRKGELERLIPAIATGKQFNSASGDPRKILQRIMISSIGGVITLLISQSQVTSQIYPILLILGVTFLLYILWGPIFEASMKNSKLRSYQYVAMCEAEVINILGREKNEGISEKEVKTFLLLFLTIISWNMFKNFPRYLLWNFFAMFSWDSLAFFPWNMFRCLDRIFSTFLLWNMYAFLFRNRFWNLQAFLSRNFMTLLPRNLL